MNNDALITELTSRKIAVSETVGEGLNLAFGKGPTARKAVLLPTETPNDIRAYVDGILSFLQESSRSRAATWGFKRAAATLLPQVVTHAFLDGYRDVAGESLVTTELFDDVFLAFRFTSELTYRLVPQSQLELWGTTVDRVYAGARSMLFHRTEGTSWTDLDGVKQLRKGDGHDAARLTVIEDFFYDQMTSNFVFSIPSEDIILGSFNGDLQALEAATVPLFDAAKIPISTRMLRFERGKVQVVQ